MNLTNDLIEKISILNPLILKQKGAFGSNNLYNRLY